MFIKYLFSGFLSFAPLILSWLIIFVILINQLFPKRKWGLFLHRLNLTKLIFIWLIFLIFFSLLLSVLQYFTWQNSDFSRFFLPPFTPIGYFVQYSFFHFWLANVVSVVIAVSLYYLFRLLKKYRQNIISQSELLLILLSSLLVGWPKFIIFVPLFLFLALMYLSINSAILKKSDNNLNWPILIGLLLTLLAGNYLINWLSLSALII